MSITNKHQLVSQREIVMPTALPPQGYSLPLFHVRRITLCFVFVVVLLSTIMPVTAYCAQVTLAWDANTEPNIAGYKIYYGTGSRSYNWFVDVGNVTSYTVTGLADGSTYYFAATAYDTSNIESTYSAEVIYNSCTFSISPTSANVAQQGGTGTVQVSTQSGCRWTASSGASWFTITAGSQGTGSGAVSYSVSSNAASAARTAASTIAGRVFTVNQAGTGTTYTISASAGSGGSISPSGTVVLSQGTSRTFTITPNSGYRVSDVRVDGSSVGAVTTYTFNNVQANHTITASFTTAAEATSLTVIAPSGGETFYIGETKSIRWAAPSAAVRFALSYSTNGGYTWKSITDSVSGTSSYQWKIPQVKKRFKYCKVRVTGYSAQGKSLGSDKSGAFTIDIP